MFGTSFRTIVSLGFAASLLFPKAHGQPEKKPDPAPHPRTEAQQILKGVSQKLLVPNSKDQIRSLLVLEELVNEARLTGGTINGLMSSPDPAVRRQAVNTLMILGGIEHSVGVIARYLHKGLDDPDVEVRAMAFVALAQMRVHAKPAIPKAKEAMKDKDARIRRAAIQTIGAVAACDKELVPVVVTALDDADKGWENVPNGHGSVSMNAIRALRACGPAAKEATARLAQIAKDKKYGEVFQSGAVGALVRIDPDHPLPLETAIACLKQKNDARQLRYAFSLLSDLAEHGRPAVSTIPELIEVLKLPASPDENLESARKTGALNVLRRIGPAAKEALPSLRAMRAGQDPIIRLYVDQAIKSIEGMK